MYIYLKKNVKLRIYLFDKEIKVKKKKNYYLYLDYIC